MNFKGNKTSKGCSYSTAPHHPPSSAAFNQMRHMCAVSQRRTAEAEAGKSVEIFLKYISIFTHKHTHIYMHKCVCVCVYIYQIFIYKHARAFAVSKQRHKQELWQKGVHYVRGSGGRHKSSATLLAEGGERMARCAKMQSSISHVENNREQKILWGVVATKIKIQQRKHMSP